MKRVTIVKQLFRRPSTNQRLQQKRHLIINIVKYLLTIRYIEKLNTIYFNIMKYNSQLHIYNTNFLVDKISKVKVCIFNMNSNTYKSEIDGDVSFQNRFNLKHI